MAVPVVGLAGRLLDLALPPACAGCGREGAVLCAGCIAVLIAGLERPGGVEIGLPSDVPAPLLQLEWVAPYGGVTRSAIHALKYGGERRLAQPLGRAVAERWRRVGAGGDVFVPVPVHRDRAAARGFDQAVAIARVAAASLGLPCAELLERHRATTPQARLDRATRATNVAGAFSLRPALGPDAMTGWWPVLVDDVATTGASLIACAEVLVAAGAVGVSAVTVARER